MYFYSPIFIEFRGAKVQQCFILEKLGNKYGPVFTLWVGPKPYVFIQDLDLAKEAFNKNEFTGRPDSVFGSFQYTENVFL